MSASQTTHQPEDFFSDYHEPIDTRGLTERQALALEVIERDGRIPPEARKIMALHYRLLPSALFADSADVAAMWDVGRTAVPGTISRARQLLGARLPDFLEPIIVRRTETGYPRTRLYAAVDVALWERLRPRAEGRWPRSRRGWRRFMGLDTTEAGAAPPIGEGALDRT